MKNKIKTDIDATIDYKQVSSKNNPICLALSGYSIIISIPATQYPIIIQ